MIGYQKTAQIGKKKKTQSQINKSANSKLDLIYKKKNKHHLCELMISKNCLKVERVSYGKVLHMTYAHRHKRAWYKEGNRMNLLQSYSQTIRCCIPCHTMIEYNKKLSEEIFKTHRSKKVKDAR